MTENTQKAIVNGGAIGYSFDIILELVDDSDRAEMMKQSQKHDSDFYKLYRRGEIKNQYIIDQKLLEMAQSGDLKAIQKMEENRKRNARKAGQK